MSPVTDPAYLLHWQWFAINRTHALLAVQDRHVEEQFHGHCHPMCFRWATPKAGKAPVGEFRVVGTILHSLALDDRPWL